MIEAAQVDKTAIELRTGIGSSTNFFFFSFLFFY